MSQDQTPQVQTQESWEQLLKELEEKIEMLKEVDARFGDWAETMLKIADIVRGSRVWVNLYVVMGEEPTIHSIKLPAYEISSLYIPLSKFSYDVLRELVFKNLNSIIAKLIEDIMVFVQHQRKDIAEFIEKLEEYRDP